MGPPGFEPESMAIFDPLAGFFSRGFFLPAKEKALPKPQGLTKLPHGPRIHMCC